MEAGVLTRVLHDFFTTMDGELSLARGDYFLIYDVIDKHWCYGQSYDKSGRFPLSHLHKVDLPSVDTDRSLFVSIAPFPGERASDLSFDKGEVIVGIQDLESGWMLGSIGGRQGAFPVTHVWQLDDAVIKKATSKRNVCQKAVVNMNLKAELEEELDLTKGDIVTIIEILDDGWCRGVTNDGRKGTFPEGFVDYLKDNESHNRLSTVENVPSVAVPMVNSSTMDDICVNNPVSCEDPAPNYYEIFPEFLKPMGSDCFDIPYNNVNPLGVKPYAITLFPFKAQFPNELSFGANEVVHLIKHIDSEWMEGSIDGIKGIFPVSYVNIIVDCENAKVEPVSEESEIISKQQNALDPGTLVKVEYTFAAQMDGDLSIFEGDIVTVVEMPNSDWVMVRNKKGDVGLCPRGYINSQVVDPIESDFSQDALEDFVVIRNERENVSTAEEEKIKRLSEPHRPAPPAPDPGRVPLEKYNSDDSTDNASTLMRKKKADQRQNVISELVITEREYVRDLKITYETFHLNSPQILESRGIDVAILFGNIEEVIEVAEELLDMMFRAMKGCDEEVQTIGPCFLKMSDKLQTVYGKYCGNHEAALSSLKKYEENKEIMAIFEKGIETLRHQIACFDMSSILIKPVQRILKYPLMLNELTKCTETEHPDKLEVEEAWKVMTDVASHINEHKRKKDLVSKYLHGDNTLMRKMAKLNMHSVAKKSSRLSAKLSATLGLTNLSADPEFEELERQFKSLEKCTMQLAKDVEQCVLYLSDEAMAGEVLSNLLHQYYQGTPNDTIKRLRETRTIIWTQFFKELKLCLEKKVCEPINSLMTFLEGPEMLITKRYDKLLDYDAAISRSEKNKDSRMVQEELATAKSNYEALNQQLLEELPILIGAATTILINCIEALASARRLLNGKVTNRYLSLSECLAHVTSQNILESFLVNHNLLWNQISRFNVTGINSKKEDSYSKWSIQNDRLRAVLRAKYPAEKLYIVTESVIGISPLDMGAGRGTLVAVIKKQDPMGTTTTWFVDNGVQQGFLSSQHLRPIQEREYGCPGTNEESSRSSTPDLMSLDSPEKQSSTLIPERVEHRYSNLIDHSQNTRDDVNNRGSVPRISMYDFGSSDGFYKVLYDVSLRHPGTLSALAGQVLKLIQPHDEKGNAEWWLMKDRDGHTGYVPSNFMEPHNY
ncbi:dynamin-binding protein [Orussus abietinus]|uniref:dynamin-binding protein n=1 Tax=Orussus abietinus TaxID=222816 RepID=UPI000626CF50|nr:dynamin-binding protein [Orussus abietinus]